MHPILKKIRAIREERKYSQEYVAAKIGTTQSRYARFEVSNKKLDFLMLEQVAQVLGVTVYSLLKDEPVLEEPPLSYSSTLSRLEEKITYLETLNDNLQQQLKDKEEIIALLKKRVSR